MKVTRRAQCLQQDHRTVVHRDSIPGKECSKTASACEEVQRTWQRKASPSRGGASALGVYLSAGRRLTVDRFGAAAWAIEPRSRGGGAR